MLVYKQWGSRNISATDFGTTIQITRPPQQYPIKRLLITMRGVFEFAAPGVVDYEASGEFMQRFFQRIQFQLGSANFLKDAPGYSHFVNAAILNPDFGSSGFVNEGSSYTDGDSLPVSVATTVDFEDFNSLMGANSTLLPNLYEDIQLNIQLPPIGDLLLLGDWVITFTGRITVTVVQDTRLQANVNSILKEWVQTTDITASGVLEIDLPRNMVLSRMLVIPLQNGIPRLQPLNNNEPWRINVNAGSVILDERYAQDIQTDYFKNYYTNIALSYAFAETFPPYFHYNFDGKQDGRFMFDPRKRITKWALEIPVFHDPLVNRQVLIHFTGRAPLNRT